MNSLYDHIVPMGISRSRLSEYAVPVFREFLPSRKSVKKSILRGEIYVNGVQGQTGTWITGGETLSLKSSNPDHKTILEMNIPVLYEDDDLAIINKPPGIPTHGHTKYNIANALSFNLSSSQKPDKLPQPQPAHRLDAATRGLMIIAKTRTCLKSLDQIFQIRSVHKLYVAVVIGLCDTQGVWTSDVDEKEAKTQFERIHLQKDHHKFGAISLLQLHPITGRTHQIRIHCSRAGHPIIGEYKYNAGFETFQEQGLKLCARTLRFNHPINQEPLKISLPIPRKFLSLFE